MSIEKAIEKINAEMQKDSTNTYLEIVGHYIIDRCVDEDAAEAILDKKKTLSGVMSAVTSAAKSKAKGNCSVMKDVEIFNAIDKYFGFSFNGTVRIGSIRAVDGEQQEQIKVKSAGKLINLDLDSFL